MSCEVFEKWKADNDPEYQAKGLAAHMAMNGISKDHKHAVQLHNAI